MTSGTLPQQGNFENKFLINFVYYSSNKSAINYFVVTII